MAKRMMRQARLDCNEDWDIEVTKEVTMTINGEDSWAFHQDDGWMYSEQRDL